MDKFIKDWDRYNLQIDTDRGKLSLWWNDVENLAKYTTLQSGMFGVDKPFSKQVFFETFPYFYQHLWNSTFNIGGFDLPDDSVVIDIGSGIGILNLLLGQYLKNPKIYLIDKEELENQPNVYYSKDYFYYNSWKPTIDCIDQNQILKNKIFMISPEESWPEQADCITSYFSWCMHYPKEVYWNKVKEVLKPGGKLIVDVRKLKDRNVVEEISDELKCIPKKHEFKNTIAKWIDAYNDDVLGYRCVWTKNV